MPASILSPDSFAALGLAPSWQLYTTAALETWTDEAVTAMAYLARAELDRRIARQLVER